MWKLENFTLISFLLKGGSLKNTKLLHLNTVGYRQNDAHPLWSQDSLEHKFWLLKKVLIFYGFKHNLMEHLILENKPKRP